MGDYVEYFTLPIDFTAGTGTGTIDASTQFPPNVRNNGDRLKIELIAYSTYVAGAGARTDSMVGLVIYGVDIDHYFKLTAFIPNAIPLHTHDGFADHWLPIPLVLKNFRYEKIAREGSCFVYDCDGTLNTNIEQINLTFQTKNPGAQVCLRSVRMDFDYKQNYGGPSLDAYEKVLIECMQGDQTLFWRQAAVELCWSFLDPILEDCETCADRGKRLLRYEAGSWGPQAGFTR